MKSFVKKISINILISSLSLLITLLLIEAGIRLIYPASERNWATIHQPNEALGWAYIPNSTQWYTSPGEFRTHIKINTIGQRDEERTYEKPVNVYRILMLGDSFVASLQTPLEQTFVKITENQLQSSNESSDRSIEVLNGGTGGYGTDQELRWFRREGIKYSPDLVILVMFLGNDIADNDFELWALAGSIAPPKPFFKLENGQLKDMGRIGIQSELSGDEEVSILSLRRFLQRYSYTFSLASAMLTRLEGQPAFQTVLRWLGRGAAADTYNHSYDIFAASPPPAWERAWQLTDALILALQEEVEASGADFRVVLIPHPVQVHRDWWQARVSLYPVMAEIEWNLSSPNNRLANLLHENDIPYLDLYPLLSEYVTENSSYLYYRSDGHFTPEGNQIVGQAIAEWLVETGSNE